MTTKEAIILYKKAKGYDNDWLNEDALRYKEHSMERAAVNAIKDVCSMIENLRGNAADRPISNQIISIVIWQAEESEKERAFKQALCNA